MNCAKTALPAGWREVRLGEVCECHKGKFISKSMLTPNGMNKCIHYGELFTKYGETIKHIISRTNQPADKNSFLSQPDDVLMPASDVTPNGLATASCIPEGGVILGGDVLVIRKNAKKAFDGAYLSYLIRSSKNSILRIIVGTTVYHLYGSDLKKLSITLPPLAEQKAIAAVLSKCDDAITATESLITAKQSQFRWLLKTLITNNQPRWQKTKLGNVCDIQKGEQLSKSQMLSGGSYPVLNGGINPSGYTDQWNTSENTVTISEGGNSCGYVNFNTEKFWASGHCYVLLSLIDKLDVHFLYYQLKQNEKALMRLRVGSGLPNIQKGDIKEFPFILPPLAEQKRAVKILDKSQKEIAILEQLAAQYRAEKRALMQNLLTGKWRVK